MSRKKKERGSPKATASGLKAGRMQSVAESKRPKFRIQAPSERTIAQKDRAEVQKYLRLIPTEAEPNLGRVREIKEEIKKGTYLTREMIEEAAMQLALRLLRKEKD